MKKIKYVFELIFTFIIPVIVMFLCFEVKTVNTLDENNNILATEKEFNFKDFDFFNSEERTYYFYEYYGSDEVITLFENDELLINYNINPIIQIYSSSMNTYIDRLYIYYNDSTYTLDPNTSNFYTIDTLVLEYKDNCVSILRSYDTQILLKNTYNNFIKSIETKTLKENFISRLLHNLFDSIGIENNVVIEVIIIYLLLTLIMFIFWNLIYYPLTIVFNIMLWKKELF